MSAPQKRERPAGTGRGRAQQNYRAANDSRPDASTSSRPNGYADPIELFKERHGGKFTRSGGGYRTNCPLCDDKKGALSVCERDGWLQVHCFKCNESRVAILDAVGLKLADIGPPRTWPASIEETRRARQAIKECGWSAALSVLARESVVVHLAAVQLASGLPLTSVDFERFALACTRTSKSALILAAKENWKPDYCHAPSRLVDIRYAATEELRRQLAQAERELTEVMA